MLPLGLPHYDIHAQSCLGQYIAEDRVRRVVAGRGPVRLCGVSRMASQ